MLTAAVGEPLDSDYQMYELPSDSSELISQESATTTSQSTEVVINKALLARIEALEAENHSLKRQLKESTVKRQYFKIEHIRHDDKLVRFYTGFISYMVFQAFFEFLGPVVNEPNYWS